MRIPYVDLALQHRNLKPELAEAISQVLETGQFVLGPQVEAFERRFADLCGVRHAIAVGTGTAALTLSLRALGIGRFVLDAGRNDEPIDEVITAPNSFVATAISIVHAGARPVFVDVRDDLNLDPTKLEAAITEHTRAILPVHLTGRAADMDPIREIAARHGLRVIEDAAQSILAEYRGRRSGSLGDLGCFSLHPLKTLNAIGDGGMITTDDPELAEQLRLHRNLGLETRANCVLWGDNSRLDTLQAAVLLAKLNHVEDWTDRRRANAARYRELLGDLAEIRLPEEAPHERNAYHTFVVQTTRRDELQAFLSTRGIGSAIHYPTPIHLQDVARDLPYSRGSFPVAEAQAERILSLPIYPELRDEQLVEIADAVRAFHVGTGARPSTPQTSPE